MDETTVEQGGQEVTNKGKYQNYQEVNGIKMPNDNG